MAHTAGVPSGGSSVCIPGSKDRPKCKRTFSSLEYQTNTHNDRNTIILEKYRLLIFIFHCIDSILTYTPIVTDNRIGADTKLIITIPILDNSEPIEQYRYYLIIPILPIMGL